MYGGPSQGAVLSDNSQGLSRDTRGGPIIAGRYQVDRLIGTYESLGVRVHRLPDDRVDDRRHPNAIFLCDVFWQTPFGAVVGRMANPVRAGEERAVSARLADLGVPVALTIAGDGLLEGADCHWLRADLALVGIGVRTNKSGYDQLRVGLDIQSFDELPASAVRKDQKREYFDTSRRGKSAAGHTYPEKLSESEKRALLEYLKTL